MRIASRPRHAPVTAIVILALALGGCGKSSHAPGIATARTYRMGFAANGPRPELAIVLQALDLMTRHSDAAIMSQEAPWDSLLAGTPPDGYVRRQQLPLAEYYRSRGLRVWVYLDPANGLDRGGEASALVAAGRSITEPEIQQLYRDYAVALDTLVRPDVFGVALETNLIRAFAPSPLYAAVRQVANDAAAAIQAVDPVVVLSASIQVETAWGRFTNAPYQGIDTDFADFPFIRLLGLSSYPYLVWSRPEDLPSDYYARLLLGRTVPAAVVEGGWPSAGFGSSPERQRTYLERHAILLDGIDAVGWFQLTFTDLALTAFPPQLAASLSPFSRLGLVDTSLIAKPALATWGAHFTRTLARLPDTP